MTNAVQKFDYLINIQRIIIRVKNTYNINLNFSKEEILIEAQVAEVLSILVLQTCYFCVGLIDGRRGCQART